MIESLIVAGVVGVWVLVGWLIVSVSMDALMVVGAALIAVGFTLGVPAGVVYHLVLYRCLAQRGSVPSGFVWNPTRYHASLMPAELRRVQPWFIVGASGFGLIMLGGAIVLLGLYRL